MNAGNALYAVMLLGAAHLLFSTNASADALVIGIRGHEIETSDFCARLGECRVIETQTSEFANGNTFVRFKESCLGQDVVLYFPATLTPDELIESLIKIRTAKQQGARSITIVSSVEADRIKVKALSGEVILLDIAPLVVIAGAEAWQKDSQIPKSLRKKFNKRKNQQGLLPSTGSVFVSGDFHPDLRDLLAQELSLPVLNGQNPLTLRGSHVFMVAPSHDPVNETFLKVLARIQQLQTYGVSVSLITPYKLYARSDKRDQDGIIITGRLIADLIESVGTKTITFVRLHAPQSEGFFSIPTFHITGRKTINNYLKELQIDMVVSPDTGAQKEVTHYAEEIGVPIAVINKQRDPQTGVTTIHGISGEDVAGKIVAVIDDETATGGTLAESAAFLKKKGAAKVIGVVTHLAGRAEKAISSPDLEFLVVTDTLPLSITDSERIKILPIAVEVAEKIKPLRDAVKPHNSCQHLFN